MAGEFEHPTAVKLKAEVEVDPWTVHCEIEHRGRQLVDEREYRRLARREARTLTIKLPPAANEWRTLDWDLANSLSVMRERGPWSPRAQDALDAFESANERYEPSDPSQEGA